MVFVFDENIPGKIVEILSILYKDCNGVHDLHSVNTLGLRGIKDEDLMPKIKEQFPNVKCVFVSGDKNILKRKPEIDAVRKAGFIGFFCAPKSCQKNFFERGLYVMNLWPTIVSLAENAASKTMFQMPAATFSPTTKAFKKLKNA